jgi:hypothetical protein
VGVVSNKLKIEISQPCSLSFFVGVILIQYQIKHKVLVIQWIYLCVVCKSSHLFWIFITEVAYRVVVPILTNREIWLGLFLVFCLLDLFQIFSVDYVFCSCYCVKFWCFNVKLNLNNLSF